MILPDRTPTYTRKLLFPASLVLLTFVLPACRPQGSPSAIVEEYLEAIVGREVVKAASNACAAWEKQARTEARSFEAVQVRLEGLVCELSEQEGLEAIVSCRGEIVADYGGELRNIDLETRRYRVVVEAGEWRMCGYLE